MEAGSLAAMAVSVMIDVHSGLPNPQWLLSPAQRDELSHRLAALPPVDADMAVPGLGYRGIVLVVGDGDAAARRIRVHHGVVEDDATTSRRCDEGRRLEEWLLAQSRSHIDTTLFAYLSRTVFPHLGEESGGR